MECLFSIVLLRQQSDIHPSLVRLVVRYLLFHISISLPQSFHLRRLTQCQVFQFCRLTEEGIVELYNPSVRTVVRAECLDVELLVRVRELMFDVIKELPVARSPTVDALFYITHDERARLFTTHGLREQYFEVLPLDGRSILKFVNHHMVQLGTYLLEDKGCVAAVNQFMQQLLGITEKETVGLFIEFTHLFLNAPQ